MSGIFRKGQSIVSIASPKCCPKIKTGTVGEVIAVRHGTNERLVKFKGKAGCVHCTTDELSEV